MSGIATYEQRLGTDFDWALREGSLHFEEESGVQKSLRRVAKRLDELGIPYAVAGGMALFFHGYRRFTEDVDILVNRDGLKLLHEKLEGLGYLPPFAGSKNLRDTDTGVRIEFLVSGDFPGDGKPKPVAFPDPAAVATEISGIKFLSLPTIVELKLASGMTNPRRGEGFGGRARTDRYAWLGRRLRRWSPPVRASQVRRTAPRRPRPPGVVASLAKGLVV